MAVLLDAINTARASSVQIMTKAATFTKQATAKLPMPTSMTIPNMQHASNGFGDPQTGFQPNLALASTTIWMIFARLSGIEEALALISSIAPTILKTAAEKAAHAAAQLVREKEFRSGSTAIVVTACLSMAMVSLLIIQLLATFFAPICKRSPGARPDRVFLRTHLGLYIFCLLVANLLQSISGVLQVTWAVQGKIVWDPKGDAQTTCSSQAFLIQVGDIATASWTFIIALHTFRTLVLHQQSSCCALATMIAVVWSGSIFMGLIGPGLMQDMMRGPFYTAVGSSGSQVLLWCWISPMYPLQRFMLHYFPMLTTAVASSILYLLAYLALRDKSKAVINLGFFHPNWDSRYEAFVSVTAKRMLMYPTAYVILILPITLCRLFSLAGFSVPFPAWIFSACLVSLTGFVNGIIIIWTGKIIKPAHWRALLNIGERDTVEYGSSAGDAKLVAEIHKLMAPATPGLPPVNMQEEVVPDAAPSWQTVAAEHQVEIHRGSTVPRRPLAALITAFDNTTGHREIAGGGPPSLSRGPSTSTVATFFSSSPTDATLPTSGPIGRPSRRSRLRRESAITPSPTTMVTFFSPSPSNAVLSSAPLSSRSRAPQPMMQSGRANDWPIIVRRIHRPTGRPMSLRSNASSVVDKPPDYWSSSRSSAGSPAPPPPPRKDSLVKVGHSQGIGPNVGSSSNSNPSKPLVQVRPHNTAQIGLPQGPASLRLVPSKALPDLPEPSDDEENTIRDVVKIYQVRDNRI